MTSNRPIELVVGTLNKHYAGNVYAAGGAAETNFIEAREITSKSENSGVIMQRRKEASSRHPY